MEMLADFIAWAWARHHNILSWYIRPLFIIPFVYFAYKRSWKGMLVTIVALTTSMFWFPAPATVVDPRVMEFLQAETEFLAQPLTSQNLFLLLTVPLFFALLALAFWNRSWWWGVAVINLGAIGKAVWAIFESGRSGWIVLVPALAGMVICDLAVYLGVKRMLGKKIGRRAHP